ncbi:MAG TPA: hypothetical protein VFJ18_14615 [Pararhizobium sp.]|nr:hypothetical protein [Pararhizobium sp.]
MMLFKRGKASISQKQVSQTKIFAAPNRGWIKNESLAQSQPNGAEVLDNWYPTSQGIRMRKGSVKRATCTKDAALTQLMAYETGSVSKLFACDAGSIYDATPADVSDADTALTAVVTGLTGGDWAHIQFTAGGGVYLVAANGKDDVHEYDGSDWSTPTISFKDASGIDVSGVASSDLSFPWAFKNRLFFIEAGSLKAWYLDSLSISGDAHSVDLGGIFKYAGALTFGGTFSRDAGSGLDDFCVFVTENGEVAVYQGNDPSSATDWSLVGVYKIGKPLGKNAFFKAGGDLAIATDDGIVSIAAALNTDRAGITPITWPIEDAWRLIINERAFAGHPFQTLLWQKQSMLVVAVPAFEGLSRFCLIANSKTGAWARYTGLDMRCVAVLGDKCYFGTPAGTVVEMETGGADQDVSYACVCIPRYDNFGDPQEKSAVAERIIARTNYPFSLQLFAEADYVYDIPAPLPADPDEEGDTWGSGIWGTARWGGLTDTKQAVTEWQAVAAWGSALSPCVQIASGRGTEPDLELIALHLQYEDASVMV